MLECINKDCIYSENKQCKSGAVAKQGVQCMDRIKPTHTPSYKGEHIEDTKEPINYEEEYNKLKKENEELEKELKDIKHIYYNSPTSAIEEENKKLKEENLEYEELTINLRKELESKEIILKSTQELAEYEKENSCKLQEEINNLNEIIERKDKELEAERKANTFLEKESEQYKKANVIFAEENNQFKNQLEELGQIVDEKEKEIKELLIAHNTMDKEYKRLKERNKLLEEKDKEQEERIQIQKSTIIGLKEEIQRLKEHIEIKDNIITENLGNIERLKAIIKGLASLL